MSTDVSEKAILGSYAVRERPFLIDESRIELGQRNKDDTDYNRENIHQRDLGSLSVIATVTRVQYGTWEGIKACLLGLRFQFQKGTHEAFRFKKVDVLIRLKSRSSRECKNDPIVKDYGPKALKSSGTDEERAPHWTAKLSFKATAGPVELGPELEGGNDVKFCRHYATEVGSDDYPERGHRHPNCVKLWMKEDKKQADGVPIQVLTAVVFTYTGPSQATIDISTDFIFSLLAQPWTSDDPVLLQEGVALGQPIRTENPVDFATLTDDEWRKMVTPDLEYRDRPHKEAWGSSIEKRVEVE